MEHPVLRLVMPERRHIQRVDDSDPLPWYYYPVTSILYRYRLQMALDLLGPGPFERVLEAGYGSGILLPSLHQLAREVYAVDLHQRTDLVSAMLRAEGVPASLAVGSVCALAYDDASFDAVVCVSTLEHLHGPELRSAIGELHRVLKPGGRAIIGVPASGWAMDLLFRAVGFSEIDEHHVSTQDDIEHELARYFDIDGERRMPSFAPERLTLYTAFRCRA